MIRPLSPVGNALLLTPLPESMRTEARIISQLFDELPAIGNVYLFGPALRLGLLGLGVDLAVELPTRAESSWWRAWAENKPIYQGRLAVALGVSTVTIDEFHPSQREVWAELNRGAALIHPWYKVLSLEELLAAGRRQIEAERLAQLELAL